jgi:hypothetical protein
MEKEEQFENRRSSEERRDKLINLLRKFDIVCFQMFCLKTDRIVIG